MHFRSPFLSFPLFVIFLLTTLDSIFIICVVAPTMHLLLLHILHILWLTHRYSANIGIFISFTLKSEIFVKGTEEGIKPRSEMCQSKALSPQCTASLEKCFLRMVTKHLIGVVTNCLQQWMMFQIWIKNQKSNFISKHRT